MPSYIRKIPAPVEVTDGEITQAITNWNAHTQNALAIRALILRFCPQDGLKHRAVEIPQSERRAFLSELHDIAPPGSLVRTDDRLLSIADWAVSPRGLFTVAGTTRRHIVGEDLFKIVFGKDGARWYSALLAMGEQQFLCPDFVRAFCAALSLLSGTIDPETKKHYPHVDGNSLQASLIEAQRRQEKSAAFRAQFENHAKRLYPTQAPMLGFSHEQYQRVEEITDAVIAAKAAKAAV